LYALIVDILNYYLNAMISEDRFLELVESENKVKE
jgi:hypothetical protein